MCTLLFAWRVRPELPLILAANRDEFYARPTQSAHFWADAPDVLGGRDLTAGGTWMGITRTGRFAALTNFRDPAHIRNDAPSRGALVADFLTGTSTPQEYLTRVAQHAAAYNGFNLVVGNADELWYFGNADGQAPHALAPGIYGLSNAVLDTPWPKVQAGKVALESLVTQDTPTNHTDLLSLLVNEKEAPDDQLPSTGVPLELERLLSRLMIRSDRYGTCCQTALTLHTDGRLRFTELSTNPQAPQFGTRVDVAFPLTRP